MTPATVIAEFATTITDYITAQEAMIARLKDVLKKAVDDEYDGEGNWKVNGSWRIEAESLIQTVESIPKAPQAAGVGQIIDPVDHINFNKQEAQFGEELTAVEIAEMMGEKVVPNVRSNEKDINKMSLDELDELEEAQDNATDIYKIAARVKNLARGSSASLTQQGEMLCNTYVHVMKAFYDFAETIPDRNLRKKLVTLVRSQEDMPSNLIGAAGVGTVKPKVSR